MKRNTYFPVRLGDQYIWLTNLNNKLGGYATVLGLTTGQVSAAKADCGWLLYVLQLWLPAVRTWALAGTDVATDAQTGTETDAMILPVFAAPALPTGVVPVAPGALNRIFALVQLIKDGGKCTDAIATDLGLIGSAQSAPDLTAVQPVIAAAVSGSQVNIKWGWGGNAAWLDMCELQVDRGDGKGFVLLAFDTTPNYTDTQAFPATLTKWSYRAIYHQSDAQVGLWSQTVSVTVPA